MNGLVVHLHRHISLRNPLQLGRISLVTSIAGAVGTWPGLVEKDSRHELAVNDVRDAFMPLVDA